MTPIEHAGKPVTVRDLLHRYQSHCDRHGAGGFRSVVEVHGMARSPVALRSGIDSSPCIYYEYRVERLWKRRPARGGLPLLGELDSSQGHDVLMARQRVCERFWLTDPSEERIVVDPAGAEFSSETVVDRFERLDGAVAEEATVKVKEYPFVLSAAVERDDVETIGFRFTESVIPLNRLVAIRALASDEGGELALRHQPGDPHGLVVRILSA